MTQIFSQINTILSLRGE